MLKHYWISAIRNVLRNKLFAAINVIGLSISIAVFLALTAYVSYQFSYDNFYNDADRIYRIDYFEYQQGQPVLQSARTHDRTALLVHEYLPQVEAVTRVYNEKAFIFTEDVRIVDQDMLFVDSSFFKVFALDLVSGSPESGLHAPHSVMISRSQAETYFGKEDPVGKILYFNERLPFTVTGVFEDIPDNSSIDFDFLLSWSTMPFNGWITKDGTFDSPWTFTFVKFKEHVTDIAEVNTMLSKMATDHITTLEKRGHTARYAVRPYRDLHTTAGLSGEIKPAANKMLLYVLLSLAIFMLVAAWINYVNLSLASSLERAGEIGIRKVFGASRMAVSGQFLMEACMLSVVTFVTGCGIYFIFTGPWQQLLFTNVMFFPFNPERLLGYFLVFVAGTTLASFYPTHFISRYKPVSILKNKLGNGKGRANYLHRGLMMFQLFLAVTVVGVSVIASLQIAYIQQFDSGFNTSQTIALRAPASTNSDSLRYNRFTSFRTEVLQHPEFKAGTSSFNIPGQEIRFHDEGVHAVGSNNDRKQSFWVMWADEGYTQTFGLTILAGRNFRENENQSPNCLINETAALALGYQSPADAVNTTLITGDQKRATVIGVLKDYHHESVRKLVEPIIFFHRHPFEYGYYSFQIQSRSGSYLQTLEKIWNSHYPNDTFVFYFMDRFFEEQYRADELFGQLLNLFSAISIGVASLGLFGMASLAMVKRTKEIGVRKVLGASVWNILVMLSKSYVKLIAVSCLFAFPIAYFLMRQWLSGFAYRIDIQWWMIVAPGIIVLVATLLTIASQAIRAALANPAKSLRDQ